MVWNWKIFQRKFVLFTLILNCATSDWRSSHKLEPWTDSLVYVPIPSDQPCSTSWTAEKLLPLLSSIRVQENTLFQKKENPLFPIFIPEWKENFLVQAEPCSFAWIWKEDDLQFPKTRILRSNVQIFMKDEGFEIEIHEWRQSIIYQNQYNYSDWAQFSSMSSSKMNLILQDTTLSQKYEIRNHGDRFQIVPRIRTERNPKSDISSKLQEVKTWFEQGLIDEKEYQNLKKEILNQYK